jgi:RecJ-like exonuclease
VNVRECPTCGGSGTAGAPQAQPCPTCDGCGRVVAASEAEREIADALAVGESWRRGYREESLRREHLERVAHALLQTMPDLRLAVGYLAPRAGPPTGGGKGAL